MAKAVIASTTGGPDVLRLVEVEQRPPGHGEAWVEHDAVGVNYLDVMQRQGAVPIPLPGGIGLEGAGRVTAVGPGVEGVAIGDRVGYILGPIGSYATGRLYPAERLVKLPDDIDARSAASILFKGITAQYLIKSTYKVVPGTNILLYGASGGVGLILASWAKHLGARVIGVVSREASVEAATRAGCESVLVWGSCDLPTEVARLTDGQMVDVVYDGIGKKTFNASIDSLRPRGMMVSIGASSGLPDPVSIATLNKNSLFLTRPGLAAHATAMGEYRSRAADVLAAVQQGVIVPAIGKSFALADAAEAHRALEHGLAGGAVILEC
ncbi:quinone oxidoreductase family protein [Agrobacterium fabrum]|uniref:quinone oxidoreductase family protein n=1 Tax=Agrobacterium fabrum TaxID=1176649 RepID=UPI001574BD7E|nr:quinone oxidoreductase [Agrobacterium fabrum]WCK80178.1 quinone oxidoreductase [Agrobacterium fabrum]